LKGISLENSFWDDHYKKFNISEASLFAQFCIKNYLNKNDNLVELGCGNGRDGLNISQFVDHYYGFDACPIAIKSFQEKLKASNKITNIEVGQADFTKINFNDYTSTDKNLVIYSRFSLHSIGYQDAENLFNNLQSINGSWTLLLEARTIFDTLYGEGDEVGLHEFQTDHYRRFIDPQVFLKNTAEKFNVKYFEINSGFAPFGNQDPVIMRSVITS